MTDGDDGSVFEDAAPDESESEDDEGELAHRMEDMPAVVRTASDMGLAAAMIETPEHLAAWIEDARSEWFRYNLDRKRWMVCADGIWRIDHYRITEQMIRASMSHLINARGLMTFTKKVAQWGFLKDTLQFMERSSMLTMNMDFDSRPYLMGVPGGVVNLKTGKLRDARPQDMISRRAGVAPAETDDCPLWRQFIAEATTGQEGLDAYLQKFIGYCLTGDMNEEIVTFLHGKGGNGKGVFLYTISAMMGEYAMSCSPEKWMLRQNNDHPDWLARLDGARLVTISELPSGKWNTAQIKSWTGKETPVVARFMYGNNFEFEPCGKLLFTSNDQPEIETVDDGVIRRMRMIHFKNKPENPDKTLKDRLAAELPEIMRWAINGHLMYLKDGMEMPKAVKDTTDEYLESEDIPAMIVKEWFEAGEPYRFLASDAKGVVRAWLDDAGSPRQVSTNKLNAALREAGGVPGKYKVGDRVAKATSGLRLNATGWQHYRAWQIKRGVSERVAVDSIGCPGWEVLAEDGGEREP